MLQDDQRSIVQIEMVDASEKQRLLEGFNNTRTDYPRDKSIVDVFEAQAAQTPDAIAVQYQDTTLSYHELNTRANQLAHRLRQWGVAPEETIALYTERSEMTLPVLLAILKAGAAYVPIDKDWPAARVEYILHDTQTKRLLCDEASQGDGLDLTGITSKTISQLSHDTADDVTENVPTSTTPNTLAYIMYTSGSTGQPKGVMVEHRNVVRLVKNTNYVSLNADNRLLQTGSLTFDAATFEIWGMLLNGGTLCLLPSDELINVSALKKALSRFRITTVWFTSSWFNQLVDLDISLFAPLHTLLVGGDRLSVHHINKVKVAYPDLAIINGYGPTENTTFSLCHRVDELYERDIPIGKPIANSTALILNEGQQLVPVGVVGEICLGGDGLARGYLNQEELTAEKFIAHPFAPGERLYRSGDLGRRAADGTISFLGRQDHQVKIRGFRIEIAEVEYALAQHPAIEKVVVTTEADTDGLHDHLVAYFTSQVALDGTALKTYLSQRLPNYMIPNAFVRLDAIALTTNGKIDRQALAQSAPTDPIAEATPSEPATFTEQKLAKLYAEVLHLEGVKATDNFLDLGGHSLKAVKLLSLIHQAFATDISLKDILQHPELRQLASYIEAHQGTAYQAIRPVQEQGYYPLSFAQKSLWTVNHLEGNSASYNIAGAHRLEGPVDTPAFVQAFEKVVERHESLRTNFLVVDDEPVQRVHAPSSYDFKVELLDYRSEKNPPEEALRYLVTQANTPFDLVNDQLFRVILIRIQEEQSIVFLNMHHIISDGWSMEILLQELLGTYAAVLKKDTEPASPLPLQYKDFAAWQTQHLHGEALNALTDYWGRKLESAPPLLNLPLDHKRPQRPGIEGDVVHFTLPAEQTIPLILLAQKNRTTLYAVLVTAYNVLLHLVTKQDDLVLGTSVAGRDHPDTQGLIGFFVNTLALRTKVDKSLTFQELLQQVSQSVQEDLAHADLPFELLLEHIKPLRQAGVTPIFQNRFVYNDLADERYAERSMLDNTVVAKELTLDLMSAKYEINSMITRDGDTLRCSFEYRTDLFNKTTIKTLAQDFVALLKLIAKNPDLKITAVEQKIGGRSKEEKKERSAKALQKIKRIQPATINQRNPIES